MKAVLLLHRKGRSPDDQRELREFGGLNRESEPNPAARPVYPRRNRLRTGQDDEHQQKHHAAEEWPRPPLQPPIVQAGDECGQYDSRSGTRQLPQRVKVARQALALGQERARTVQLKEAKRKRRKRQEDQCSALPRFCPGGDLGRRNLGSSSRAGPRSSRATAADQGCHLAPASSAKARPRSS